GVTERTVVARTAIALDDSDVVAALPAVPCRREAHNAAADDGDAFHELRMPQRKGSRSSNLSRTSAVTKAVPVIVGTTADFDSSAQRYRPSKCVPKMLSWIPGLSRASLP